MIRQFVTLIGARVVGAALQAAVGIALARMVTPTVYGHVTAVAGVLLFLFIATALGVPSYLGRARALGLNTHVAAALRLNLLTTTVGVVIVAAGFTTGLIAVDDLGLLVMVLAVGSGLDKNIDCALALPIADGVRTGPAVSILIRRVTTAAAFFLLVLQGQDAVLAYCWATLAGPLVGQLHLSVLLRSLGTGSREPSAPIAVVMRAAGPFAVNDIALQSRSLDTALVALVATPTTAGLYAGASKLTAPFELVSSTLASIVLPRSVHLDRAGRVALATKLTLAAGLLALPAALIAYFARPIVVLVLGADYSGASTALALIILALPATALSSPLSGLLQGVGEERFVGRNAAVFALATLAGVGVGASLAGSAGAALAILCVAVLKVASLWWHVVRAGDPSDVS